MKIAKSLKLFQYRMNLRKTLVKEPIDLLLITKEEVTREINRRHKNETK